MSRAKDVKYIVHHCSAGFASAMQIMDYFTRPIGKGGRGWKTGGYHRIIERNGAIFEAYPFEKIVNGVKGFNSISINICYVGGVNYHKSRKGIYVAEDTRTPEQKRSQAECVEEAIEWLANHGKNIKKELMVLGHRDFSKDQNKNGIIEPWERIKECPSHDTIQDFYLYSATNSIMTLPSNRERIF